MSISHIMLWCTAIIWGFAFVAQSAGMENLGPYSFNAARFAMASCALIPLLFLFPSKQSYQFKKLLIVGSVAGVVLFIGSSLQQIGLLYTSAGNAGFITSLYIVLVPIFGLLLSQKTTRKAWLGIAVAIVGFYILTIEPGFKINYGDALEFIGAMFWASHVLVIGYYSRHLPAIPLSIIQCIITALLSIIAASALEDNSIEDFKAAWLPLLYAGVASSSIAYTLQIIGQKKVSASISALILSTESVFAVIGGWLFMGEILSAKAYVGCAFILLGMIISQWPQKKNTLATAVTTTS
ncbi:DMT family transporter [Marinomonas sp. 15G1-11]|uniref:DMT family transporter n=1 Tax=Marinomonas phaeophyticola TaxID=3004091 RepID=A0ABT4JSA1_9GAMM|nr:DMT family transporter [Marinomonas sp. 15G1-11]MCZ2721239.1 DMT family transporter [Marinomonas sp. 15G1-11]